MTTWSVVIATHSQERWAQLLTAVDSVLEQSCPAHEIIVVVDHNEDLLARVSKALHNRVTALANEETQGLSGARNTGIRAASGTWVAFLDDDARADTHWLDALQTALANPKIVGVGGLAVPDWETGASPPWLPEEFLWVVGCHYTGHRIDSGPIRSPIGANMAFSRSVILDSGGFSPTFSSKPFNRCDDVEFSLRVKSFTNGEIHFQPAAIVHHFVSTDRSKWRYFVERCLLEGRAKAALTSSNGLVATTQTERRYVFHTLGTSFGRYLRRAAAGSKGELVKAINIIIGLAATVVGFVHGKALYGRMKARGAFTDRGGIHQGYAE